MKFSSRPRMSRRAALRGAGVSIALPWLEAMAPRRAGAATAPRRFAVVFFGNGVITRNWNPSGGETSFTLPTSLAPLKDLQSKIVVLQGVNNAAGSASGGNGHNSGTTTVLTARKKVGSKSDGWGAGPTIDQVIANKVGQSTRFPSLQLGVATAEQRGDPKAYISYAGSQKPLTAEDDPRKVFARVFAGVTGDPAAQQANLERKRSILDLVRADLQQLNRRLGASDRAKLDQHLTGIDQLERRLMMGGFSGAAGKKPAAPPANLSLSSDNFPMLTSLMMDMLAGALATDQTRVVTLQLSTAQSPVRHGGWVGPVPSPGGHHGVSHQTDGGSVDALTRIATWFVQQYAALGKRLQSVNEGGSSLLDNTTVLLTSEVSVGSTHSFRDMPYVLMGGCGGAIKTGRHLSALNRNSNDLFVSLQNAMGVPDTTFGDAEFCKGPLPGLVG
jgi:hypothetical protein